jgi:hypothetical protein
MQHTPPLARHRQGCRLRRSARNYRNFPSRCTEAILKGRFDTAKAEKKTRDADDKETD